MYMCEYMYIYIYIYLLNLQLTLHISGNQACIPDDIVALWRKHRFSVIY